MSFFERAKAAANDLAAKADAEMRKAGISTPGGSGLTGSEGRGSDQALRDLGVLAYLEATGRPVSVADRERVLGTLRDLEASGRLGPLTVAPPSYRAPGAPPPPPGAAAAAAGAATPPPPPPAYSDAPPPPPPPPPGATPPPPGATPPPPPPPPSWA